MKNRVGLNGNGLIQPDVVCGFGRRAIDEGKDAASENAGGRSERREREETRDVGSGGDYIRNGRRKSIEELPYTGKEEEISKDECMEA